MSAPQDFSALLNQLALIRVQQEQQSQQRDAQEAFEDATLSAQLTGLEGQARVGETAEKQKQKQEQERARGTEQGKPPPPVSQAFPTGAVRSADATTSFLQTQNNFANLTPSPGAASSFVQRGNQDLLRGPNVPAQGAGPGRTQLAQAGQAGAGAPGITTTTRGQIARDFGTGTSLIPTTTTQTQTGISQFQQGQLQLQQQEQQFERDQDILDNQAGGVAAILGNFSAGAITEEERDTLIQQQVQEARQFGGATHAARVIQQGKRLFLKEEVAFNRDVLLRNESNKSGLRKAFELMDSLPPNSPRRGTVAAEINKIISPGGQEVITVDPETGRVTITRGPNAASATLSTRIQQQIFAADRITTELNDIIGLLEVRPELAGLPGKVSRGLLTVGGLISGLDTFTGGKFSDFAGALMQDWNIAADKGILPQEVLDLVDPTAPITLQTMEALLTYQLVRLFRPQRPNIRDFEKLGKLVRLTDVKSPQAIIQRLRTTLEIVKQQGRSLRTQSQQFGVPTVGLQGSLLDAVGVNTPARQDPVEKWKFDDTGRLVPEAK